MSQKELADASGVAQPLISQFETDARFSDAGVHQRIADALGVPATFLTRAPMLLSEGSLGYFRSTRSKVASVDYNAARRKAEMGIELVSLLAEEGRLPTSRLESVPDASPDEASILARSMLRLPPDAPVPNLTRALERAGALVFQIGSLNREIHGFSAWASEPLSRPVFVARGGMSAFRLRFTLAHELGHLVLGHQVFGRPTKDTESEANRFAATFLLPTEAMQDAFAAPIDIRRLAELKGVWGVSMSALLHRAKSMGFVDEGRYRALYETLRKKGWLKREPGDDKTVPERPRLMEDLARAKGMEPSASEFVFKFDFALADAEDLFGTTDLRLPMGL